MAKKIGPFTEGPMVVVNAKWLDKIAWTNYVTDKDADRILDALAQITEAT